MAEPIQTVMRRYNIPGAYEKLKDLTRGAKIDADGCRAFISSLEGLPEEAKAGLLRMEPRTYIGDAVKITEATLDNVFRDLTIIDSNMMV